MQVNAIADEADSSTLLRLLYEVIQWDAFHAEDLEAINKAIVTKAYGRKYKALAELFLICFLQANIGVGFKEKYYVFDEDESEVRRQLRLCLYTHLIIFILLAVIVPTLSGKIIAVSLYMIVTVYWGMATFTPVYRGLKKHFIR
ncbi:hypothetical protein [Pontibacter liquoris]|uniref:hypothetical protein n=1 Tax=Pontibacter liquoris TaxID=2905677 RepID=UPI001FA80F48|nr:hypothetical protein [Pontibacter liquoris]